MAIEIVSFPIKNGGSFHSYVSLPEGNLHHQPLSWTILDWQGNPGPPRASGLMGAFALMGLCARAPKKTVRTVYHPRIFDEFHDFWRLLVIVVEEEEEEEDDDDDDDDVVGHGQYWLLMAINGY